MFILDLGDFSSSDLLDAIEDYYREEEFEDIRPYPDRRIVIAESPGKIRSASYSGKDDGGWWITENPPKRS